MRLVRGLVILTKLVILSLFIVKDVTNHQLHYGKDATKKVWETKDLIELAHYRD